MYHFIICDCFFGNLQLSGRRTVTKYLPPSPTTLQPSSSINNTGIKELLLYHCKLMLFENRSLTSLVTISTYPSNVPGQIHRQIDRQSDRQIYRQIDTQVYKQIVRQINRQIDIQIVRQKIDRQIDRQIDRYIYRYIDRQ